MYFLKFFLILELNYLIYINSEGMTGVNINKTTANWYIIQRVKKATEKVY